MTGKRSWVLLLVAAAVAVIRFRERRRVKQRRELWSVATGAAATDRKAQ